MLRDQIPSAPTGLTRLRWYGPGLLWMLAAVGTGSVLFTPRVASVYQYQLYWMLVLVVFFMYVMIREMARFSIVSGRTVLDGIYSLGGPAGWAVWIILIPQLLAAAVGVAGIAAIVGSAMQSVLPGSGTLYAIGLIVLCVGFVFAGRYAKLEKLSRTMAIVLMGMTVISAGVVFPDFGDLSSGLIPSWPEDPELYVILPWIGTILAGSMGIVWFGYWTAIRGYGGGLVERKAHDATGDKQPEEKKFSRAHSWIGVMSGTAAAGVIGGLIILTAFMVLGAELLAPAGILPEGPDVAVDLSRLFSEVWGEPGRYLLLLAIIIALGGSVLADQDGWSRSFSDMTLILDRGSREARPAGRISRLFDWLTQHLGDRLRDRAFLTRVYLVSVTGIVPVIIVMLFSDPVEVMSASGIIAAAHTPFIVFITLYLNRTRLPRELRPGNFISCMMALAGLFYLSFAGVFFWDLFRG
jgi:Mn2+/Fe2+ NRAMP family transporter